MGHIRDMAEKRADHLQFETVLLRNQAEELNKLLSSSGIQGTMEQQVNKFCTFVTVLSPFVVFNNYSYSVVKVLLYKLHVGSFTFSMEINSCSHKNQSQLLLMRILLRTIF